MLELAEAAYPPREEVVALIGQDSPDLPDDNLWWYDSVDGIPIPYAITAAAIDYYCDLVALWRAEYAAGGHVFFAKADVRYQADVTHYATYEAEDGTHEDVFVVTMELAWSVLRDPMWGHSFEKERTVVLSRDGSVLLTSGDGFTDVLFN